MKRVKYVYYKEDDMWVGYLEQYPDYMTQGETIEELEENLIDIYKELESGAIPFVRKVAELKIA
jgi:predicted RNase H-like HicB family nuclease